MIGMPRIGGRDQQRVAADAAAVLRGTGSAPAGADRPRCRPLPRQHGLEPDHVLPVVAEIVCVEQRVADVDQHLIQPHLLLRHALVTLIDRERAQVVLGLAAVVRGAAAEPVQVRIGPAERGLDDLVHFVKEQIRREFQPPPYRRPRPSQIYPDPQRHQIRAAWPSA